MNKNDVMTYRLDAGGRLVLARFGVARRAFAHRRVAPIANSPPCRHRRVSHSFMSDNQATRPFTSRMRERDEHAQPCRAPSDVEVSPIGRGRQVGLGEVWRG